MGVSARSVLWIILFLSFDLGLVVNGQETLLQADRGSFRDCAQCPLMKQIPEGEFDMGSPSNELHREPVEGPKHPVSINYAFAIGVFEVTKGEYAYFVDQSGYQSKPGCRIWTGRDWAFTAGKTWADVGFEQQDRDPVLCINWFDATAYVVWLREETGHRYRLPSESEWEYAARAGTDTAFVYGATITSDQANYWGTYSYDRGPTGVYRRRSVAVGTFKPNAFGLYDVHGNAGEWVDDCWSNNYVGAPKDGSARELRSITIPFRSELQTELLNRIQSLYGVECPKRMVRGGAWNDHPKDVRSASRLPWEVQYKSSLTGFRVVRSIDARDPNAEREVAIPDDGSGSNSEDTNAEESNGGETE